MRRGAKTSLGVVVLAVLAALVPLLRKSGTGTSAPAGTGAEAIAAAYKERRSDVVVEASGTVVRVLRDDETGSRHQRFIVRVGPDLTVLIAHNIDLAPRVPVRSGETVSFRGEYEWNEKGGVIHWTHHDPGGRRPGGWIRLAGREYR